MTTSDKYIIAFLVHEATHILQRLSLQFEFEKTYYKLIFKKKDVKYKLLKIPYIKENWISNPDGLNGEWLYKINDVYICPLFQLNDKGDHDNKFVKFDKNFEIIGDVQDIKDCKEYRNFNNYKIGQNDHHTKYLDHIFNTLLTINKFILRRVFHVSLFSFV